MGGPGSRALFDRAQARVTALAPTAVEKHYPTQKTATFDPRKTDDFVYVNLTSKGINVGFFYGTCLPDQDSLLTGPGRRRMRHVKVTDATQLDLPQLGALIEAARDHAESE